jgi:hypothetical protein
MNEEVSGFLAKTFAHAPDMGAMAKSSIAAMKTAVAFLIKVIFFPAADMLILQKKS